MLYSLIFIIIIINKTLISNIELNKHTRHDKHISRSNYKQNKKQ